MVALPEQLIHQEKRNAVIAGTGFSEKAQDFEKIHTDYGDVRFGHLELGGKDTIFIARHQRLQAPFQVNYRANAQALKLLGVNKVASISAAGRMRKNVLPGHLVNVDDLTFMSLGARSTSFSEEEALLLHSPTASPYSEGLRQKINEAWKLSKAEIKALYALYPQFQLSAKLHTNGTYFNSDPPWFNTGTQEAMIRTSYRNMKLIGQTLLPEAALLREMGMAQVALGMCTDHSNFPGAIRPVIHAGEGGVMDIAAVTSGAALLLLDNAMRLIPDDYYDSFAHESISNSVHPDQVNWHRLRWKRPRLAVIIDQALPT
ncbi:hypothetical protein A3D76_04785, partial [Candidatus Roizmanbacteria bacterium RIFCSPHIGHO2_02_FULL_37_9b]